MADAAPLLRRTTEPGPDLSDASVIVDGVHIRYRVYEDRRPPGLRERFASGMRPRRYEQVHAVQGVSLVARHGETIGLIGRNGSGKSTLLRAIAGLMPVNEGTVQASAEPVLLGVGAVLQGALSGRDNIMLGALALGMPRSEVEKQLDAIIDFAGIRQSIDRPLRTYSSGMRARLQFAAATAVRPEILLIDEALAVGDEEFQSRSRARVEELRSAAGTVFLVTHSMRSILDMCTRAVWLDQGRLRFEGEPDACVAAYRAALKTLDPEPAEPGARPPPVGRVRRLDAMRAVPVLAAPARSRPQTEVIGHRGASAVTPENTLAAVEAAIRLGVDRVEVDVRRSRDGQLFLMHDATVERTTDGGPTPVGELDAADLRRLDAGGWFSKQFAGEQVPPLADVVAAASDRVRLLVEVKSPRLYPGIARDVVAALDGVADVMVQSFRLAFLKRLRVIDDGIPLAWLVHKVPDTLPRGGEHVEVLAVQHEALHEAEVDAIHQAGLGVFAWTVNDPERIRRLQEMGVDAVVTDHPERLILPHDQTPREP